VHGFTVHIHGHGYRHILDLKLVDRLHAHLRETQYFCGFDCLGHQVSCTTHRHQVDSLVVADGIYCSRSTLGFTDHPHQTGLLQHGTGELIHACGSGGAGGANHLITYRIDRTDVVNETPGEIHG